MVWSLGSYATFTYILALGVIFPHLCVEGAKSKASKEAVPKGPQTYDVKLYAMKQFEGKMIKLKVEMDACVNLPSSWEKQVVSVDPSGCIILYADQDCRGFRKRLDKWSFGSSNLRDIAFESKLSSISTCPKKPTIPDEDEL